MDCRWVGREVESHSFAQFNRQRPGRSVAASGERIFDDHLWE